MTNNSSNQGSLHVKIDSPLHARKSLLNSALEITSLAKNIQHMALLTKQKDELKNRLMMQLRDIELEINDLEKLLPKLPTTTKSQINFDSDDEDLMKQIKEVESKIKSIKF